MECLKNKKNFGSEIKITFSHSKVLPLRLEKQLSEGLEGLT